jgi:hypothetical protein
MEGMTRWKGWLNGRVFKLRCMTLPLASSRGASLKGVGSGGLTMFLINTHSCFLLMRFGRAASQTSAYPAHSR